MGCVVKMNYDELRPIVKKFRDEGEDIVQLHIRLRERVRDLHKDWEGESSERFFKEMENEVLPAVSRLAKAIFHAQDVLQKITKTIQEYDEATKRFFNSDFTQMSPEHLGAAEADSWERTNQYKVWEANRKEFIYPENLLQPEQRGDASGSSGRLVIANEFTGEVSMVDVTASDNSGPVTPQSSDKKDSSDENGTLPDISSVTVDR